MFPSQAMLKAYFERVRVDELRHKGLGDRACTDLDFGGSLVFKRKFFVARVSLSYYNRNHDIVCHDTSLRDRV